MTRGVECKTLFISFVNLANNVDQGGAFMELKMINCEQMLHGNTDFIHREQHVNDTANTAVQQEHCLYMKSLKRKWESFGHDVRLRR